MVNKKLKLLIVDDEKDICTFVKILFRKKGFSVYSALSGVKAVQLAKKVKPHVALLDIHLKTGITGLEVLKQINESLPNCRCVMVTWDKMKEAKTLGAADYLTKPLTTAQLFKVVNRVAKIIKREAK
jgi:CheY-like chemotaxis protein